MLQPIISLVLLPVLDNAGEEIFLSRVNRNGTPKSVAGGGPFFTSVDAYPSKGESG